MQQRSTSMSRSNTSATNAFVVSQLMSLQRQKHPHLRIPALLRAVSRLMMKGLHLPNLFSVQSGLDVVVGDTLKVEDVESASTPLMGYPILCKLVAKSKFVTAERSFAVEKAMQCHSDADKDDALFALFSTLASSHERFLYLEIIMLCDVYFRNAHAHGVPEEALVETFGALLSDPSYDGIQHDVERDFIQSLMRIIPRLQKTFEYSWMDQDRTQACVLRCYWPIPFNDHRRHSTARALGRVTGVCQATQRHMWSVDSRVGHVSVWDLHTGDLIQHWDTQQHKLYQVTKCGPHVWIHGECFPEVRNANTCERIATLTKPGTCFALVGNTVWAGSSKGVWLYDADTCEGDTNVSTPIRVRRIVASSCATRVWLMDAAALLVVDAVGHDVVLNVGAPASDTGAKVTYTCMATDGQGRVWIGTSSGCCLVFDEQGTSAEPLHRVRLAAPTDPEGAPGDALPVSALTVAGELVCCAQGNTFVAVHNTSLNTVSRMEGFHSGNIMTLGSAHVTHADGNAGWQVWAGCRDAHLSVWNVLHPNAKEPIVRSLAVGADATEEVRLSYVRGGASLPLSEVAIDHACLLGDSQFGSAYKGTLRGDTVAVKELDVSTLTEDERQQFCDDMQIHDTFVHTNANTVIAYGFDKDKLFIVERFAEGGSLYAFLRSNRPRFYQRMRWATEVLSCLQWLHGMSPPYLLLGSLRTCNILLDRTRRVLVDDIASVSRVKTRLRGNMSVFYKSYIHLAPEVLQGGQPDERSDVYSFAMLLWELTNGERPWRDINSWDDLMDKVVHQGLRPNLPKEPVALQQLFRSCWAADPEQRPSLAHVGQQLQLATIDHSIGEPNAVQFWADNFVKDNVVEIEVEWSRLLRKLSQFLGTPFEPTSLLVLGMQHCLKVTPADVTTLSDFGSLVKHFGPLDSGMVYRMEVAFMLKGFFGHLDNSEANRLVAKRGQYLIRFGTSDPNSFILVVRNSKRAEKAPVSTLVLHKRDGKYHFANSTRMFDDLQQLVSHYKDVMKLKKAVEHSPFEGMNSVESLGYSYVCE